MIEAVKQEKEVYLANFAQLERELPKGGPTWLHQMRKASILHFAQVGFPTTREEEWKYTNVAPLGRIAFQAPAAEGIQRAALERLPFADLGSPRLVFVNGSFRPELSSHLKLPEVVKIGSLADALQKEPELVRAHLTRYASYGDHAFNALNTAFLRDGAFLYIPKSFVLEQPIHLLFISTANGAPVVSHPRTLIVADNNSQITIVEHYAGVGEGTYFTNPVTEMAVGDNAVVDHYRLQNEGAEAFHVSTLQVYQNRNSNVTTHSLNLGGLLVRNHLDVVLEGEGSDSLLNGLFLVNGRQHVDNHTGIEHAKPHCNSRELYKGVLDGKSRGVFHGRILVRPGAQKTDSKQTNKNLLLSDEALINTKPQLEIYADDVKCTHGATIGQLDKDAIFYLRSRGISVEEARSLLIYAFAAEVIGRVRIEDLRSQLNEYLLDWLPKGAVLREV